MAEDQAPQASPLGRRPVATSAPSSGSTAHAVVPPRAPRELLEAVKKDLLAKLSAGAVRALTEELQASLEPGAPPASPALLREKLQALEDVLEALYLGPGSSTSGGR